MFAMIVVGGITRVTRSGLSITTWEPVTGVIPPTSDAAWHEAFERYRASPEGTLVNTGIDLEEFRALYLVEYGHRLLGRITGLVLAVPLVLLLARRRLGFRRARFLLAVLGAGLVQGALGWYMVASGLVSEPHVSPFRLAGHLVLGMTLLAALVFSAIDSPELPPASRAPLYATSAALVATASTAALGALMAGFHAGLVCSTFPTMNGAWIPPLASEAWTIHFLHRLAALVASTLALATAVAWRRGSKPEHALAAGLVLCVAAQITLGALLVVHHVPPALAVVHQGTGALVIVLLSALLRRALPHRRAARRPNDDVSHGVARGDAAC